MALFKKSHDRHLLNEIRAGNLSAQGKLFTEYKERLEKHVLYHGTDVLDGSFEAEDIACMAIYVLIDKAREQGEHVLKEDGTNGRFLFSTANNLIRRERQAQLVRGMIPKENPEIAPEADALKTLFFDKDFWRLVFEIEEWYNREKDARQETNYRVVESTFERIVRSKFVEGLSWNEVADVIRRFDPSRIPPYNYHIVYGNLWRRVLEVELRKRLENYI